MPGTSGRKRTGEGEIVIGSKVVCGSVENPSAPLVGDEATAPSVASPLRLAHAEVATAAVTPDKVAPVIAKKHSYFLMNLVTFQTEIFYDLEKATNVKEMMLKHQPRLESYLVIEEFDSETAALQYLALVRRMGSAAKSVVVDSAVGDKTDCPIVRQSLRESAPNQVVAINGVPGSLPADAADDDDVPFEPLASSNPLASTGRSGGSTEMGAFAAATVGCGARISVMRWRLPTVWHVYAFQLMDSVVQYWSHKPAMWTHAANCDNLVPIYDPTQQKSLFCAMNKCFAANIRASPGGDNIVKQIKTSKGLLIDQNLLVGLCSAKKTNEEIGAMIKSFIDHCSQPEVRQAYWITVNEKMNAPSIKQDCDPKTGKYWMKLATGGNNMQYTEMKYLNEIFLDSDIITLVNLAYRTRGATCQSWAPEARAAAFGPSSA